MQRRPEINVPGIDEDAMLSRIRKAAKDTLEAWPEARAAVLFGSRARGDHSPVSDWDIAFITGTGERTGPVPAGLPIGNLPCEVECLALPETVARRKALVIGHVARGIVRDGKLLAGSWNRPNSGGVPVMGSEEYAKLIKNSIWYVGSAATTLAKIGKVPDWDADSTASTHFTADTADAAEHLAKAMLGRRGIEYEWTHDLNRLAEQARRADFTELAGKIRSMNGLTRTQHMAMYLDVDVDEEGCRHAVRRLHAVIGLLGEEIRSAKEEPRLADSMIRPVRTAFNTAREGRLALQEAMTRNIELGGPQFDHDRVAVLVASRGAVADSLGDLTARIEPEGIGAAEPDRRPLAPPKAESGDEADSPSPFDIELPEPPTPFD